MDNRTEALLKGVFVKDEEGNVGIRYCEMDPADTENAVNSMSNRTLEQLLQSCVVVSEEGGLALRLCKVNFSKTVETRDKEDRLQGVKQEKARKEKALAAHKPKQKEE